MTYFCYISDRQVTQLIDQFAPGYDRIDQYAISKTNDGKAKASALPATIADLLSANIEFGKTSSIQYTVDERKSAVERLQFSISHLYENSEVHFLDATSPEPFFTGRYYIFSGRFQPLEPVYDAPSNSVVELMCMDSEITVILSCTLSNFSEGTQSAERFQSHSGNHMFFTRLVPLDFRAIFLLNHYDDQKNILYGSPLFLQLTDDREFGVYGISL